MGLEPPGWDQCSFNRDPREPPALPPREACSLPPGEPLLSSQIFVGDESILSLGTDHSLRPAPSSPAAPLLES